jgi:hypothetical protein
MCQVDVVPAWNSRPVLRSLLSQALGSRALDRLVDCWLEQSGQFGQVRRLLEVGSNDGIASDLLRPFGLSLQLERVVAN